MTANEFQAFWESTYANAIPVAHTLRNAYPDRWLRIHSLPLSKRYPESDLEWATLLFRQNTLITDLLNDNSRLLLVTGEYDFSLDKRKKRRFSPESSIKDIPSIELKTIDLDKQEADERVLCEYSPGDVYRPVFTEVDWQTSSFNNILRDVAEDTLRVLFISIINECIIAPYDGGVDIILKDSFTRNSYKAKYINWLSDREDSL